MNISILSRSLALTYAAGTSPVYNVAEWVAARAHIVQIDEAQAVGANVLQWSMSIVLLSAHQRDI